MSKPSSNTFLVSDESINSYNCRLISKGGDATAFESNPVMLYMHKRGSVIGRWVNLILKDGSWYADPVFDLDDKRECGGAEIGGKVERGFLKAASAGVRISDEEGSVIYNDTLKCYDIMKWSFQEISIVDIGSNANALKLYDASGEPMDELRLSAHLEQFKPSSTTPTPQISLIPQSNQMELKTIALALGLPDTATEQEVLALASQNKTASAELVTLKAADVKRKNDEAIQLVDQAVDEKRIPATAKDTYLKLFAVDHESAKTALAAIPKPQSLITLATGQQALSSSATVVNLSTEDRVKKYDELDKAGTLLKLAQSDKESFNLLFEAKFGVKPDKVAI
ncbi:hypothetical protein [Spirosoma aerolatum]|uniref:hypothetical protein n=1 Tax=Spirosoma aerolatum TaxID=1211326 RepID=UPI0009ADC45A|nr:hypothetical protein [Spirosoma aerolatum]